MRTGRKIISGLVAMAAISLTAAQAQPQRQAQPQDQSISIEARDALIATLADAIEAQYVDETRGAEIADALREASSALEATDTTALQREVTELLFEISDDRHLSLRSAGGGPTRMRHSPDGGGTPQGGPARRRPGGDEGGSMVRQMVPQSAPYSGEMLDDYVGVITVPLFMPDREQLAAAFEAVADAEAIILDVRGCPGGAGNALMDLAGVFVAPGTVMMESEVRDQGRSETRVPDEDPVVPRRLDVPLYIATSGRTGSACEELTFDLKHHGRATVVGERTGGAGHGLFGGGMTPVGLGLSAFIPNMRPHHPAYPAGFEGTGVLPDIAAAAASAVEVAHLQALEEIGRSMRGSELAALQVAQASATQAWLSAQRERVSQSRDWWHLVGIYGDRVAVAVIDAELYLISRTGRHTAMRQVGDGEFVLQGPSVGPMAGDVSVSFDTSGEEPVITINQIDGTVLTLTRGDSYYLKGWIG